MAHILLRHRDVENIHRYDIYAANGGYEGLKKALREHEPAQIIEMVRKANIRGRGGAGFPAGVKWGFIPKGEGRKYVVVNADESEAGTFKDRELIEYNPHQVIEGALICAYAIGAEAAYIYFRGEFMVAGQRFEQAIREGYANNAIGENIFGSDFSCHFLTHYGAGAYICGEETALLESLEGKLGQPRVRPPFPAQAGLYAKPTVVNNVETLANVPPVITRGPDWYLSIGTDRSPGPKIVCLSGHVKRPGNYEVPMGTSYRELIFGKEYGGGMSGDQPFKALLPSGGSAPVVTDEALDAPISFEGLEPYNSLLGSASLIVMDASVDMVWAASKLTHFFRHESCGKCTPCREGTYWMDRIYERLLDGRGRQADVALLESVAGQMQGEGLCALGEFATSPVLSTIRLFPEEYRAKVNGAAEQGQQQPAEAAVAAD
ncbi:MAG: NADH-quinone oxidoreductase subunit NuoF [Candidatus Promineifilaceae bacterium]|nr:NADH-quinone oxidoreductase subunit NuoF [Candidatus Promineifilaceae bacterium]